MGLLAFGAQQKFGGPLGQGETLHKFHFWGPLFVSISAPGAGVVHPDWIIVLCVSSWATCRSLMMIPHLTA